MKLENLQFSDSEIVDAMAAIGGGKGKPVRKKDIKRAEDIFSPQASVRERKAYRELWRKIFQLIEQRWQKSRKTHKIANKGLFASPANLIDRIVRMRMAWKGRDAGKYEVERLDLIIDLSELLMLQNFRSFARRQNKRSNITGLGSEFPGFMYTALCYRLLSMQHELRENLERMPVREEREEDIIGKMRRESRKIEQRWFAVRQVSLQDSVGKDSADEDPYRYEKILGDTQTNNWSSVIYVVDKGKELPILFFSDERGLQEFCNEIIYQIEGKEKQLKLFEYHQLAAIGELEIDTDEKIKQYIIEEMGISSNVYDVNMTRLRIEIMNYLKGLEPEENGGMN